MANSADAEARFTSAETLVLEFALSVETRMEHVGADGSRTSSSVRQSIHIRGEREIWRTISPDIARSVSTLPERRQ